VKHPADDQTRVAELIADESIGVRVSTDTKVWVEHWARSGASYSHDISWDGQLPAYEWAFADVNPPVHAWAAWRVYKIDKKRNGKGDRAFLERVFHKLLLNFTWWVNRKDAEGMNIFQGGFPGLDNIGVFDRSAPLPTGGYIEQSDGTSWMAMTRRAVGGDGRILLRRPALS
jgi:hypothetical protein